MTRRRFRIVAGCLLIILSIIVSQIPTGTVNADETAKTSDFELDGTTLVRYTGTAKTVSVPDSVKVISPEAFVDNTYLTTLKLPGSLKEIGMSAFSGCSKLEELVIPDSVEKIGNSAFSECKSLKSVSIGKGLEKLGTGVFLNDKKLTEVKFTDNSHFLCDDGIIYDNKKTEIIEVLSGRKSKEYKMPSSVVDIRPYAFYGCNTIEKLEISNSIKSIPPYAFSLCTGISTITIPYSVNTIDIKAFENCVNIKDVYIKEAVNYIADSAFDGCSKLNIISPENSYADEWFKHFETGNVVIVEKEDSDDLSDKPINDEPEYTETKVPVDIVPIPGQVGETYVVGRHAVFVINNTERTVLSGIASPDSSDSYSDLVTSDETLDGIIRTESSGKGLNLPKFAIVGDTITAKAFYQDDKLKEYTIADDITKIDDFAFARSALKEITIPDSVTHIGYGAFYHCDDLAKIVVPSTVTVIEPSAFDKTRMMDNWLTYGTSDFLVMGDGILVAYKGYGNSVSIPEGVKQIGPECFKNRTDITEVELPDSLKRVCEEAFSGCSSLKVVSGGLNVTEIEDRAFSGCPLNTVRVFENVVSLGLGAFDYTTTSVSDSRKVAVFLGDTIPKLSVCKTSTRLTNDSYRTDALSGINVCIVNNEEVLRNETVLDRNVSGFSGIICVITRDCDEYSNGKLKIIDCTLSQKEAQNLIIPDTVFIYGKGYNFDRDELNSVMEMAKEGAYLPEEKKGSNLSIQGTGRDFILNISKGSKKDNDLKDAYKRIYGDTIPQNFTSFDITLQEADNEILLSKLGKMTAEVVMDIPNNIPTANLHVICLDENSQLEDLPYDIEERDGKLKVCFSISHTGAYGLYAFNSSAVSLYNLDDTPDTGDWVHPKWFLCIGLFALGVALVIMKPREKYNIA